MNFPCFICICGRAIAFHARISTFIIVLRCVFVDQFGPQISLVGLIFENVPTPNLLFHPLSLQMPVYLLDLFIIHVSSRHHETHIYNSLISDMNMIR